MSLAVVAAIAVLPWLTILPLHGASAVLAHVLTLIAAFHGAGQTLAWAHRRDPVAPALAIQWGIALLVALSGVLMLLHAFTYTAQIALVTGFAAIHTVVMLRSARAFRADVEELFGGARVWLVPTLLLAALGAFLVVAAAGDVGARPFDDDGNVLAQLQRLRETGTLADGLGYARRAQLGGQLVLASLATVPGDVHLVRSLEPIACVLALALVLSRLRVRDAFGALLGSLVVIAAVALPVIPADPVACWTAVGLVAALHGTFSDEPRPPPLVVGLVAGALITLRFELVPIALVALVCAGRRLARPSQVLALVLGTLVVAGPYVVVRTLAMHGVDASLLADRRLPVLVGLAAFAGTCLACAPIVIWTWRSATLRWFGLATAFTLAGLVGEVTGDRPYALRFLWPVIIAFAVLLVIELARARTLSTALMIFTLLVGAIILHGRTTSGRVKWARRVLDYSTHVGYLSAVGDDAPISGGYARLLAQVPRDSTVAVWVTRPERLPYGNAPRIVDLRTPRTAHLRRHRWELHASKLETVARTAGARYVLIERDDQRAARARANPLYRALCATPRAACADDLELLTVNHPVIAEADGVQLVQLR